MGMEVLSVEPHRVLIQMPRALNLNPHSSIFGGSLSALGLVSGYSLIYCALEGAGLEAKLVGHKSEAEFLKPAIGDCIAETACEPELLSRFLNKIKTAGIGRISILTTMRVGDLDVATHTGVYAAVPET